MKFEFAYEKLLEHRKTLEDVARKEHAVARGKVDEAEAELKTMYDDVGAARLRAGKLGEMGGAQGPALVLIDEFINGHRIRIERQRQKIRTLLTEAEAKHAALVEAARERKTLQKLKERRLQDFKKALKKREMKQIDEIVTTRFGRKDF